MKAIRKILISLALLAVSAATAFADIAPLPKPGEDPHPPIPAPGPEPGDAVLTNSQPEMIMILGIVVIISAILAYLIIRKHR
jgi:hypothetical protein